MNKKFQTPNTLITLSKIYGMKMRGKRSTVRNSTISYFVN